MSPLTENIIRKVEYILMTTKTITLGLLATMAFFSTRGALAAKVLIIGDSLSATPSWGLASKVFDKLSPTNSVMAIGSCGSSPWWYQDGKRDVSTPCGFLKKQTGQAPEHTERSHLTPKLKTLVQPDLDLAVIQQGTNLYGYLVGREKKSPDAAAKAIKSDVLSFLRELKKRAPQSSCLWVAPPQIAKYDGISVSEGAKEVMFNAIQSALVEFKSTEKYACEIHDSRLDTGLPRGDGTHFSSPEQTQKWVQNVSAKCEGILKNRANGNSISEDALPSHH